MNVLPQLEEQATTHMTGQPSPFIHFDESKNQFVKDTNDPCWKEAVLKKFEWVRLHLNNHMKVESPSAVAYESDRKEMEGRQ
jgi:hypothetical protein